MYFRAHTAVENARQAGIKANLCRPNQCFNAAETYAENVRARESIELYLSLIHI